MAAANYIFWYPVNHKPGFNLPKANITGAGGLEVNSSKQKLVWAQKNHQSWVIFFNTANKLRYFINVHQSHLEILRKAFYHHLCCLFAVWNWQERERRAGKVWTFVLKWAAINQIYRLLAAPKNCQWSSNFQFFSFSQPIRTDAKFWQVNRAWGTKSNPLEAFPSLADCQFCQMRW